MKNRGFTLIELSIVLVIIGLLAAGILVGRDLINAAEIRATIAQVESFNTAIRTFQGKYNGLPGDLSKSQADGFGFFSFNSDAQGLGDNNGLIQSNAIDGQGFRNAIMGEPASMWRHLGEANLIPGRYGQTIDPASAETVPAITSNVNLYLPQAKVGGELSFRITELRGIHYYWLTKIVTISVGGQAVIGAALTPLEAQQIDSKLDDGMPNKGSTTAAAGNCIYSSPTSPFDACWASPAVAGTCLTGGSGDALDSVYATSATASANAPACGLQIRLN